MGIKEHHGGSLYHSIPTVSIPKAIYVRTFIRKHPEPPISTLLPYFITPAIASISRSTSESMISPMFAIRKMEWYSPA